MRKISQSKWVLLQTVSFGSRQFDRLLGGDGEEEESVDFESASRWCKLSEHKQEGAIYKVLEKVASGHPTGFTGNLQGFCTLRLCVGGLKSTEGGLIELGVLFSLVQWLCSGSCSGFESSTTVCSFFLVCIIGW